MYPIQYSTRTAGSQVPARSKDNISGLATAARKIFGLQMEPFFPIVKIYEALDIFCTDARFEVWEPEEMDGDHGRTYPDQNLIVLRKDVYEGANEGRARDRFTMCHELGHLLMHKGIAFSRIDPENPPKIYRNSEWQADKFASYLLMPPNLLHLCYSEGQGEHANYIPDQATRAAKIFGVSFEAAFARREEMKST